MAEKRLNEAVETTKDTATAVAESARKTAARVGDSAESALSTARSRTDEVAAAAGEKLQAAAGALRERAPQSGMVGSAAQAVADRLEGAGLYLQEENLTAIGEDLGGLIRRYPIHALIIGATLGFLLGRARR